MNGEATDMPSPPWWQRCLIGRRPAVTLVRLIIWVGLVIFAFRVVWLPVRVQGISMAPAYRDGRANLIFQWAYRWHPPQRGDVVGIKFVGVRVMLLKRIIGLPGERLAMHQGVVYINGEPLEEPYVQMRNPTWERPEEQLRPDEYFVIGDNRGMGQKEHTHGKVEASRIVGRAMF